MIRRSVFILALAGLVAVSAQAQKLDISFDKRVNFSSYKTYMWGEGTPAPSPVTSQLIVAGIDERLAAAGWQKVSGNADVLVIYHVSVLPETKISSYSVGGTYEGYQWGAYSYYGDYLGGGTVGEGAPTDKIETIQVGELLVDMAEVKTKNFMWRGAAKETLKSRDPKKIQKKVKSAISRLFKDFPPGTAKN